MTEMQPLTRDDLFTEIADVARDQGVSSHEAWNELVDQIVDDHLQLAELDEDQDIEGMKDVLKEKWDEYKQQAALEAAGNVTEEKSQPSDMAEFEDEKNDLNSI